MWGPTRNFQPLRSAVSSPSCLPLYLSRKPQAKLSRNLPRRNRGQLFNMGMRCRNTSSIISSNSAQPLPGSVAFLVGGVVGDFL